MLQATGSWSLDTCCAVPGNGCKGSNSSRQCYDHTSSANWLFGLWPAVARFDPRVNLPSGGYVYQNVRGGGNRWPAWGCYDNCDLCLDKTGSVVTDGGGYCSQGHTFRGTTSEICGSMQGWGQTAVEVWRPIDSV